MPRLTLPFGARLLGRAHRSARSSESLPILGGRILRLAAGIGALILLSRILPLAAYGEFALIWTFYQTVSPLISGGLSAPLSAALATREADRRKGPIYGTLGLLLGVGTLGGAALIAVSLAVGHGATLLPFGFFLPAGLALITAEGIFVGLGRHRTAGLTVAFHALTRVTGLAVGALASGSVAGALWGLVAASWFSLAVELGLVVRLTGPPASLADLRGWRTVVTAGALISLSGLLGSVGRQIDRFLVAALEGTESLAVYVNGSIENPAVLLVTGSIFTAGLPRLAQAFRDREASDPHRVLADLAARCAALLYPMLWLSLWGAADLIAVAFTDAYGRSAEIFRIYALLIPLRCLAFGPIFVAAGRTTVVFRFAWIFLVTNALLTVLAVQWLGITGAAWATVVSFYASVTTYWMAMKSELDLDLARALPWRRWARLLVASGACALPLLLIPGAWSPAARLLAGSSLYALLYLPTLRRLRC